jgi:uncharacterized membrane protein
MTTAPHELLAEGTVEIGRSCDDAYAYVSNLENFPAWFPGVAAMRALDATAHGSVGKRYRETVHLPFGRTTTIDIEVKEAQPGAHLVTEGQGLLLPCMRVQFTALSGARTRIDWRMVSRNHAWWFRRLAAPLLRAVLGRRARRGLRQLRLNLETELRRIELRE